MIPFGPLSGQAKFYFILFSSFALAALQNVTVDDAVLTGAVVPQYLPSGSAWNIGNTCTGCLVKPDPSLTYDGTWHDCTFSPSNGFTQAIAFTFTGSALYIFFIIANTIIYATTFTDVEFVLDGVVVNTYSHTPSATANYQYNVPVYVNESLAFGEHSMTIQPVNSGNQVLILFDYLIYTTDTSSSVSPSTSPTSTSSPSATSTSSRSAASTSSPSATSTSSPSGTSTSSPSGISISSPSGISTSSPSGTSTSSPSGTSISLPSPTSSGTQGTSSGQNIGTIVGGTVGGIAAIVLVAASLLCYRRYKNDGRPSAEEGAVAEPFILSCEVAPTSLVGTTSSTHLTGSPLAEPVLSSKAGTSSATLQPSIPPPSTTVSSSPGAPPSNNPGLLEQVGLLRDEVARLRYLHDQDQNTDESQSEAPPEYS